MNVQEPAERTIGNIERVIVGKHAEVRLALVALMCEGHILIEDVPGVGKTMLAKALSRSIGCSFRPHPVHAGPAPVGRHRPVDLQPEVAGLRVPPRTDHGPGRAGRRDQPGHAQDPERAPRVHGGAAGHDRRRQLRDAEPVPRHRHPEPDRVRGHLRPARGAAGPIPAPHPPRLPQAHGGARHPRRAEAAPPHRIAPAGPLPRRAAPDAGRGQGDLRRPGRGRLHHSPGGRDPRARRRLPRRLAARLAPPLQGGAGPRRDQRSRLRDPR